MNQDNTNATFIDNLPYGHVYTFRVGILDFGKAYWSDESNELDLSLSNLMNY